MYASTLTCLWHVCYIRFLTSRLLWRRSGSAVECRTLDRENTVTNPLHIGAVDGDTLWRCYATTKQNHFTCTLQYTVILFIYYFYLFIYLFLFFIFIYFIYFIYYLFFYFVYYLFIYFIFILFYLFITFARTILHVNVCFVMYSDIGPCQVCFQTDVKQFSKHAHVRQLYRTLGDLCGVQVTVNTSCLGIPIDALRLTPGWRLIWPRGDTSRQSTWSWLTQNQWAVGTVMCILLTNNFNSVNSLSRFVNHMLPEDDAVCLLLLSIVCKLFSIVTF